MLIIISDPHSFAMCCSEALFVITLQWASVVGSRCSGCYEAHPLVQAHPLLDENLQSSLHCTFVFYSKCTMKHILWFRHIHYWMRICN